MTLHFLLARDVAELWQKFQAGFAAAVNTRKKHIFCCRIDTLSHESHHIIIIGTYDQVNEVLEHLYQANKRCCTPAGQTNLDSGLQLEFRKHNIDPCGYFAFATHITYNATKINFRYIGKIYRRRKLMKTISLNYLSLLYRKYGANHLIQSCAIHFATYKFFEPQAIQADFEMTGALENVEEPVLVILSRHQYLNPSFGFVRGFLNGDVILGMHPL